MSGATFTPGPWRVERGRTISAATPAGSPCDMPAITVCEVFSGGTSSLDQADANAHLIAAAPDLYEALRALVMYQCDDQMPRTEEDCAEFGRGSENAKMLIAAMNAIAKAEGRA